MARRGEVIDDPAKCEDCGHTWPRDPSLEVECPTCGARVGFRCTALRPSGHRHSSGFAGLKAWGHDERDLLAAAENKYGCGCGMSPERAAAKLAELRAAHTPQPT